MTQLLEVYKCEVCGNIVEVTHSSQGTLVCCGQNMTLLHENTTDAVQEKHVPVLETTDDGILVTVGSVEHPMEEKHYIEWIELLVDSNKSYIQFLKPGEKPQALFKVNGNSLTAREYCNVHGHWKSES